MDEACRLAEQINKRLAGDESKPLAVKAHKGAVERMGKLRDILQKTRAAGTPANREMVMLLIFAGISITRRVQLNRKNTDDSDMVDLKTTLALLFVLQVLCKPARDVADIEALQREAEREAEREAVREAAEREAAREAARAAEAEEMKKSGKRMQEQTNDKQEAGPSDAPPPRKQADSQSSKIIKRWESQTLVDIMNSRKRRAEQEADVRNGKRQCSPDPILRPQEVCVACLDLAETGISDNFKFDDGHVLMANVVRLAELFFHTTAGVLGADLLNSGEVKRPDAPLPADNSFLTLASVDVVNEANADANREELVETIVGAAEAEVGQQIVRDYILSMLLPLGIVGVRRTPLLGRSASNAAAEFHAEVVNEAYESANLGSEYVYANSSNETHRMAALLAGLSILLTQAKLEDDARRGVQETIGGGGTAVDALRLSDAFGCRVSLPWICTKAPPDDATRLALLPLTDEWLVFRMRKGKPHILLRQGGLEGLKTAALLLTKK